MSLPPTPSKRDVLLLLLEQASVFIHLDPRREGVVVPPWFKKQPQLVLQIGLNMAVPIRDLDIGEEGVGCTLSFNRSPFFCYLPWTSIFGLVGEDGRARLWTNDIPREVVAQMNEAAAREKEKKKQKERIRLAPAAAPAVSSPLPTEDAPPVVAPSLVPEAESSVQSPSQRPAPGPQSKRPLPPYLRVVK